MRLFLIHPPSNFTETGSYLEPLGLAYVAGVCRAAGHRVAIRDLINVREADVPALLDEMHAFRPEVVGFSTMSENHANGLALARAVRERFDVPVVFGGWHVSGDPVAARHPDIDYVVIGEGEETMLELLEHLAGDGSAPADIPGLAFFGAGGEWVRSPARSRIRKLDALPEPMRDGLPMHRYRYETNLAVPSSRMRAASVSASRGCPYKCTFCQTPSVLGPLWAPRSAASVVDEVERLVDERGINTIFFRDEEFTIRPRAVFALCEELARRDLPRRLSWAAFMRVDDITSELAAAMAGAGCGTGVLGLEVSDDVQAEKIDKHFSRDEAESALRLLSRAEILTQGTWIVGFPWDTRARLEAAFDWLTRLELDLLYVFYATPLVGTPLRRQALEQGLLLDPGTEHSNIYDVSIRVPGIPLDVLARLRNDFNRRFYLRPAWAARMAGRMLARPVRARSLAELVWRQVVGGRFLFSDPRPDRAGFRIPAVAPG